MIRLCVAAAILLGLAACADAASTFAASTRSWCKTSPNCSVQE